MTKAKTARRQVSFAARLPESGTVYRVNAEGLGVLTLEVHGTTSVDEAVRGWMRNADFVVTVLEEPAPERPAEDNDS